MPETLVLDCSVVAKWALPEPQRDQALRLFEQYESGDTALIAPDLLLAEFASLLARRSRRKEISPEQAQQAFQLMTMCAPRLFDMRPRLPRALDISTRYQMSLWDSVYLALAFEYDCPLITADRRLFRAAAGRHPSVRLLS